MKKIGFGLKRRNAPIIFKVFIAWWDHRKNCKSQEGSPRKNVLSGRMWMGAYTFKTWQALYPGGEELMHPTSKD